MNHQTFAVEAYTKTKAIRITINATPGEEAALEFRDESGKLLLRACVELGKVDELIAALNVVNQTDDWPSVWIQMPNIAHHMKYFDWEAFKKR